MSEEVQEIEELATREYKYGFITDVEQDAAPPGLDEETIAFISRKKNEPDWLLQWRLRAFHNWLKMDDPTRRKRSRQWAMVDYPDIDYQKIIYYSAPKKAETLQSLDEVDPEILRTYEKLGIPLEEQKILSGVAVDAVFDSVSVATTFKDKLSELGIVFCSFSEAVQEHPDLVKKYLGSVVPYNDNFFAALNSAVFTDGSFCYIPRGVRCPMELSTYFRINAANTGQFERDAHRRGRRLSRFVSRRLHRPPERRESASRRCRGTGCARQCANQILDRSELVPRRRKRCGRDLQLRHQTRRLPRRQCQDLLDTG